MERLLYIEIPNHPEQGQRASRRPWVDAGATCQGGWGIAPEHQLDRTRPVCAQPDTGTDLRESLSMFHRSNLYFGERAMNLSILGRKIPILGQAVDERFLRHRLQSTSFAGILGGVSAIALFGYRYYIDHVWSWDLFALALIIVGVKMTMMVWYFLTD
jgi:hypothetical protein